MGTNRKITAKEIENFKPPTLPYKLNVDGPLYLFILKTGTKVWKYRIHTREEDTTRTIGHYPEISLSEARVQSLEIQRALHAGDEIPTRLRPKGKEPAPDNTFAKIARDWIENDKPHASLKTTEKRMGLLVNYL